MSLNEVAQQEKPGRPAMLVSAVVSVGWFEALSLTTVPTAAVAVVPVLEMIAAEMRWT